MKKQIKVVYAESSRTGEFLGLTVLSHKNVIKDSIDNDDGTSMCKYFNKEGKAAKFYYIAKTIINSVDDDGATK